MKKFLILFLLGAVVAAAGWHFLVRRPGRAAFTERVGEKAAGVKEQAADSARELGGWLGDTGIITLIKGKYAMEKDLSALAITIECRDGQVTLRGSVESAAHISRAVTLARQTKGVTGVNSLLTVKS